MSNPNQSSYTSYSSSSFTTSSSSSTNNQPHTQSYVENITYDSRHGGSIQRTSSETGQPTLTQRQQIPVQGTVGAGNAAGNQGRIEDVTDQERDEGQEARDREYEERIEEEYAKREGGA